MIRCGALNNIINSINYTSSSESIQLLYNKFNTITDEYYESIEILEKATPSTDIIDFIHISVDIQTECSICQDTIDNVDLPVKLSQCGHIYHKDCLVNWLKRKNDCPVCRMGN